MDGDAKQSSSKKIKISFYDPFSVYPKIQKDLESKLPLTNLHWKATEKSPLRSIPSLDVEFVEEIPKGDSSSSLGKAIDDQMQKRMVKDSSLLKRASTIIRSNTSDSTESSITEEPPVKENLTDEATLKDLTDSIDDSYLKIMIFEAQNIEQYKSNVRPFIKEWFKQSVDSSKLPTDWILLFYVSQGSKDDYTTAFKYGLLDKIKLDFNNYKNNSFLDDNAPNTVNNGINSTNGLKILKIKHDYPNQTEYNQAWNSVLSSIKTGILSTFTERINFFEFKIDTLLNSVQSNEQDDKKIRKIDNGPPYFATDMNIGLYFLMNENLAILYHDLNLFEDSLNQYDTLEKIFEIYLERHSDNQDLSINFLRKIGFERNLVENKFYFNIFKSLKTLTFNENNQELTDSTYELIAPEIFNSLTNFNNLIFLPLRQMILSNEISYFDLKNYFFLKAVVLINSIVFKNFSQLSSTPSVNSVYIFDLLKRLKKFIIDLNFRSLNFDKDNEVDQFKLLEYNFTTIDNYLLFINEYFFKPPQKNSVDSSLPPLGNKAYLIYSKSKEINNIIGELRLLQRFMLVVLGKYYEYKVDNMNVDRFIDMKFDNFIIVSTDEKKFDHPLLTKVFENFESFAKYFKYLTESAIGNFNISDKPRTVDILSIDISLLNYQLGNYNDSLTVLLNCPNFYNEQGWDYIGFYLLQVFINCLEKVLETPESIDDSNINKDLLVKSYLDLLATLIDSSKPRNFMIDVPLKDDNLNNNKNFINKNLVNIAEFLTSKSEIQRVIDQMIELKNEVSLEYDLQKIFQYKIEPYILSENDNVYSINIEIHNVLIESTNSINFDEIELTLQSLSNKNDIVKFQLDNVENLKIGENKLKLHTKDIIIGRFAIKSLRFKIGGINLFKNHINLITNEENEEEEMIIDFKDKILIHPYINNVNFELANPLKLNLNYKQFLLKINVGNFDINNLKVQFESEINGFELISNDLKALQRNRILDKNVEKIDYDNDLLLNDGFDLKIINEDSENLIYNLQNNDDLKNSVIEITIPYNFNTKGKNFINLKTILSFSGKNNENYSIIAYQDLNTSLTIAVSVQDSFKSQNLFSRFSIGTADINYPIRILETELFPNENYNISTALKPNSLIAFGEQPISYFFKISANDENYVTKENDSLKLVINYRNLSEEIFECVWLSFKEFLIKENIINDHFNKYILLMKDYLFKLLRFDLNHFAIFNEIEIQHFSIYDYVELFTHFFPNDRSKYLEVFKKFINLLKEKQLSLPIENFQYYVSIKQENNNHLEYFKPINRELFINVPIPLIKVVHNLNFEFEQKSQYIVGEPITTTFQIKSFVNWRGDIVENSNNKPKKKKVVFEDPNKDSSSEQFQIDIIGPNDNWLISGKKKFQFIINKNQDNEPIFSELFLIPLKIGKLVMPKIEVKSTNNHLNDDFSMEIDYKNSNQTIMVVPNLDRVTFAF